MRCLRCQRDNRADARFCDECGARLEVTCARCGRELRPEARFCDACGTPAVGVPAPMSPEPASERNPAAYTPRHLAEKILTTRASLEGERKQVTVLFADVKGSLELAEQVDAEEWHRILDRFFQILADGIHRFEGTINQYTGDGIMALFGAPIAHEDHAQRACYAALHVSDRIREYAGELRRERGLNFSVRMGLNSGEVVVGKIGDDLRMDYTAQGHTVGLAARMERLAEAGRVYLTEHTAALVSGYVELEDLGRFEIRGAEEPLRGYELRSAGRLRTRLDVARERGLSRFVGRSSEIEILERAAERAQAGEAQVVGVVGEAGVGKSRLCFEFLERCRARGVTVRESYAIPHGEALPFYPILQLLRGYFGVRDTDSPEDARRKIAGELLMLDMRDALPLVFGFLGVADAEQPAPVSSPEEFKRQLYRVVARVVNPRRHEDLVVFLCEDLHWMDPGTAEFLEGLISTIPDTRTLVLVNTRPEFRADWMQRPIYQQIGLAPLGSEEVQELLQGLLGHDRSLHGLPELIRERTGGNPFFIEEVVQSLVESGSLEGTAGTYRLTRPPEELVVPPTVQAVLAARIDRLPEREKQLLQVAAVIGKKFPERILRRVSGSSETDLVEAMRRLKQGEFVFEEALYPETEWVFKHPLTQEVAYNSQLTDRRARLHASVAAAIEEDVADKPEENAALLAHHWEGAGDALRAARWHQRAAEWAARGDPVGASHHWRKVHTLADAISEPDERAELRLRACLGLLTYSTRLPVGEVDVLFEEGRALALQREDPHSLVSLLVLYGGRALLAGELEQRAEHLRQAERVLEKAEDVGLRFVLRAEAAATRYISGDMPGALRLCDEALELLSQDPGILEQPLVRSRYVILSLYRSMALARAGRLEDGIRAADRMIAFTREHRDVVLESVARMFAVLLMRLRGDAAGLLHHARELSEMAERLGSATSRSVAVSSLAMAHMLEGRWAEATARLEEAVELDRETGVSGLAESLTMSLLAQSRAACGDARGARVAAEQAIELARKRGTRTWAIEAHLARARVLLETEGAKARDGIEHALRDAEKLTEETGAAIFAPFIACERAKLARLLGDDVSGRRELREAQRRFAAMGATGHAQRVARELDEPDRAS